MMTVAGESVFDKIGNAYSGLTTAERKVADYITTHQQQTQFLSITELAVACEVADATISRFCRRLGYQGYNAFKLAVATGQRMHHNPANPLSGEIEADDAIENISQKIYAAEVEAMRHTMLLIRPNVIRRAADMIDEAGQVFCMGQGGSLFLAQEAAHLFSTIGYRFYAIADSHLQMLTASTLRANDIILFFSFSGSTSDLPEIIKTAHKRGGSVILVTRFDKSPGAKLADLVLQCGANESPLQVGSVSARIAQMYLLDVLFAEISRRHPMACKNYRQLVAEALAQKHL